MSGRAQVLQSLTGFRRSRLRCACAGLAALLGLGSAGMAEAAIHTSAPQFLPLPSTAPPPAPLPLAPPINPGYVAAPPDGISPILTTPGPVFELPQPQNPSYPAQQLPGPIDQQKMQAYYNGLRSQQWQLQSQGVSSNSVVGRAIMQQLNAPDAQ